MSDERITLLRRRRSNIKAACTRYKNYFDSFVVTNENIAQARIRLEKLNENWTLYNEIQSELELLLETEGADREHFENAFFALSSRINVIIDNARSSGATSSRGSSPATLESNIRLPKITLPTFSDNFEDRGLDAISRHI